VKQELDITSVGRGERRDVYSQGASVGVVRSGGAVDWKLDLWIARCFVVELIGEAAKIKGQQTAISELFYCLRPTCFSAAERAALKSSFF